MVKNVCFCFLFIATTPLWSQVEPSVTVDFGPSLDDTTMMTPPPVSRDIYPVIVGLESRSNHFSGGLIFTSAYTDNLVGGESAKIVSDETYSFMPTISIDRRTPRDGETLDYSAGFNLYQNTSQLNGVSQNGSGEYRFHISPYTVISLSDSFWQNSNLYNQANPFIGAGGSTGAGSSNSVLIAPFADQIQNFSSAGINYQYAKNAMVGGSAFYSFTNFSNSSSLGLNNENLAGGSGFYSRRLAPSQYVGVTYQFDKFVTHPIDTYTVTHTLFGFYTHYFTNTFSISILGGPEEYASWNSTFAKQGHWIPAGQGSIGWQRLRTNLVASFTHSVSGAPGLIGAYQADMAGLTGRFVFSRTWNIGASGVYSLLSPVKSDSTVSGPGGHSLTAGIDLQHAITERLNMAVGYQHFHESYASIPTVSSSPDSNRVYVSLSYGFHRPLGR